MKSKKQETISWLRIVSALYTLIFAIMLIATMVLLVFEINLTLDTGKIPF